MALLVSGRGDSHAEFYTFFKSWSVFAAKMKSLSVNPLILWVQMVTFTLPHAR